MSALLDHESYYEFLARTHPKLCVTYNELTVPTFIARLDPREPLLPGIWRRAVNVAAAIDRTHVLPRSLFLGTPFERYDQTHLLDAIDDPAALAERAEAICKEENLHNIIVTNIGAEHARLPLWEKAGFVRLPSFPDTVIDLAQDWNSYLAGLPAGDRSGMRRNIRRFDRAGHTLERLSNSRAEKEKLWTAYKPMFDRAKVRWQPHTQDYFSDLAALHDDVRLTVARNTRGETIGFVINFADPAHDGLAFQAGRVGVCDTYFRQDAVYFRLLYHLVEESLLAGGCRLSLEPTGYRMKRHLGARAVRLVNLVKGVSPTWRLALSLLAPVGRSLLSHLEDLERLEEEY